MNIKNTAKSIFHLVPLALFVLAIFIVHHEIKAHNVTDIKNALSSVPVFIMGSALVLTIINYMVLSFYDVLALRYTGHKIPLIKVMLASLIGYAISNNTGHAWASGGSVRYRFYSQWKVPGWDIVKISFFLGLTYIIGIITLGLVGTIFLPADLRSSLENPQLVTGIGWASGGALIAYWLAVFFWHKPLKIKDISLSLPSARITLAQTIVSCIDVFLASLIMWVLLAGRVDLEFGTFFMVFVIAQVAGLFSQVPGGIGVFEGMFLWLIGPALQNAHPEILSALILFRVIYFFIPLGIAGVALLSYESVLKRQELATAGTYISKALSGIVPRLFSILLFMAGAALLVSGATPSLPEDILWIKKIFPLPVVELSNLLSSLIGVILLFLARGIRLRIDAAWYGSIILLTAGIITSLLKGFIWQEAAILTVMLVLMVPTKQYFRRHSSLLSMNFSPAWILLTGGMLVSATWVGFFSFRHIEYSNDLWWQFSYDGDAPRFLRALVVSAVLVTSYTLWRLLAPRHKTEEEPDKNALAEAGELARKSNDTKALLCLLGDKHIFWSETKRSFIMYSPVPKFWIAMGDPIGDPEEFETLLWQFREKADKAAAKAVFYEVSKDYLPLYMDIGLILLKLGEDARIPLTDFTLEGKKRESLRQANNRFGRLEYEFKILEGDDVAANMKRLREISDAWLARKNTHEKGFSLGFFDEGYVANTSVAVAIDPSGNIMAFANLWLLDNKEELSVDIMRYDPESPSGIMDFLFARLMLWGHEQHYKWFNLGMAPLAGLERHPLAPLWHKIGTTVFDLGEEFYHFEGLYNYKAKFEPTWEPRYLAVPVGLSAPAVLLKTTALISGGWKHIFMK